MLPRLGQSFFGDDGLFTVEERVRDFLNGRLLQPVRLTRDGDIRPEEAEAFIRGIENAFDRVFEPGVRVTFSVATKSIGFERYGRAVDINGFEVLGQFQPIRGPDSMTSRGPDETDPVPASTTSTFSLRRGRATKTCCQSTGVAFETKKAAEPG